MLEGFEVLRLRLLAHLKSVLPHVTVEHSLRHQQSLAQKEQLMLRSSIAEGLHAEGGP